MAKRSGVAFEISTVIFVLFSLTFTKGDIKRVRALEGYGLKLNLSYPRDSARFTLQKGGGPPFYDSANPESLLFTDNKKCVFQNETESNNCTLYFTIDPVLRCDEGGYILIAYDGDGNFLQDTRFRLRVDYPPGKASCKWGEENAAGDWRSLECTAPSGSFLGEIVCYSNTMRVPPVSKPRDDDSILEQTMWARYSQPAFCCAAVVGPPVDRCTCKDYKWDPYNNIIEPCPVAMVTTYQEASTSSQSPTTIPSQEVITQMTKKNHRSHVVLHVGYSCAIGILVIIIISLCIALRKPKRKAYQVKENIKKSRNRFRNSVTRHCFDELEMKNPCR